MQLFDLHADLGYAVLKKHRAGYSNILSSFYTAKLRAGNIKALCMASYFDGSQNWEQMQEMVTVLKREIACCEEMTLVCNASDIDWEDDRLYAMLSIEGMCGIRDNVESKLDWLYEQGVRLASLCWNEQNELACGVRGSHDHGLTALGIRVVQHMEKLGMRIDVSHADEQTFWDIVDHTSGILVASHSNASALCSNPRNLTQDQIKVIAERNGVIGVVAAAPFVHFKKTKQDLEHYLKQVQWITKTAGIEHVGYGFDFMEYYDGTDDAVKGISSPQEASVLGDWISRNKEYKKTAYENAVRVFSY